MAKLRSLAITGDNLRLRVVPNWKVVARQWHHFSRATTPVKFVCGKVLGPDRKWEGTCLACDFWRDNWSELRGDVKPTERYYTRVVERFDTEVKVFTFGKGIYQGILAHIVGDHGSGIEAKGDVTHPYCGCDFTIEKKLVAGPPALPGTASVMYPNYTVTCHKPSPIGLIAGTDYDPQDFSFADDILALDNSEEIERIIDKLYKKNSPRGKMKTKWRSIDDVS